jgi:membrane associated rhomboid family serine protease
MFPYKAENPTELPPYVTVGIIALNVLVWVFVEGLGSVGPLARAVCQYGLIPGELLRTVPVGTSIPLAPGVSCVIAQPHYVAVLTSMFMHGGWFHLIGNMWFLWVFGNNIEDAMGHGRFVVFYLLCGVLAAAAQVMLAPQSAVPMVGASGAISGVLGAYLLLYPRVRVHVLVFLGFFVTKVVLPAYVMLGYWVLLQLLGGLPMLGGRDVGGVAFFAHLGGFLTGLLLVRLFIREDYVARRPAPDARWREW